MKGKTALDIGSSDGQPTSSVCEAEGTAIRRTAFSEIFDGWTCYSAE